MVSYYIRYSSLLNRTVDSHHVEESLVTGSELRSLLYRKHAVKLHCNDDCVDHLVFCITGVYVSALDVDLCTGSIEILILQLANLAAVHGVGIFCTEFLHVKLVYAASDLLVGSKTNLNLSVFELRMLHNVLHCTHNLCNTRLVIGTQKGGTVGGDKGLAFVLLDFREI